MGSSEKTSKILAHRLGLSKIRSYLPAIKTIKIHTMETTHKFQAKDRFLPLSVFKFPLGNCGGITDEKEFRRIYIPCEDGHVTFDSIPNPELRIFVPEKRGEEYWALKPILKTQPGFTGPMAGGNLAYSSDSRCERVYHIHDRYETNEQYASNW